MITEDLTQVKQDRKALMILCCSLIIGVVLFMIISLVVHAIKGAFIADKAFSKGLLIITLLFAAGALVAAHRVYQQRIDTIKPASDNLPKRLNDYRAALILFFALCEAPALFSIIAFILTGNYILLAIVLTLLAFMLRKLPTNNSIVSAMALTVSEQSALV